MQTPPGLELEGNLYFHRLVVQIGGILGATHSALHRPLIVVGERHNAVRANRLNVFVPMQSVFFYNRYTLRNPLLARIGSALVGEDDPGIVQLLHVVLLVGEAEIEELVAVGFRLVFGNAQGGRKAAVGDPLGFCGPHDRSTVDGRLPVAAQNVSWACHPKQLFAVSSRRQPVKNLRLAFGLKLSLPRLLADHLKADDAADARTDFDAFTRGIRRAVRLEIAFRAKLHCLEKKTWKQWVCENFQSAGYDSFRRHAVAAELQMGLIARNLPLLVSNSQSRALAPLRRLPGFWEALASESFKNGFPVHEELEGQLRRMLGAKIRKGGRTPEIQLLRTLTRVAKGVPSAAPGTQVDQALALISRAIAILEAQPARLDVSPPRIPAKSGPGDARPKSPEVGHRS